MNLKEIRKNMGFSLRIMAQVLGIPKNTYVKIENGERSLMPDLEKKVKQTFFFEPKESVLVASFDWVSLHFRCTELEEICQEVLHLPLSEWVLEEYSRYHYPVMYRYGALTLYADLKDEKHGLLLELSGTGCREMEGLLSEQGRDWYDLFNDCLVYEAKLKERFVLPSEEEHGRFNVTRLDLALDEFYSEAGNYDLAQLLERFKAGLVSTKKRRYSSQSGGKFTSMGLYEDGLTLYLGSPQSTPFFRFYQKDAEQAKALLTSIGTIHELYGFCNRYEVVLRGEKAHEFVWRYVLEYFDIAQQAVGIINAHLVVFEDFEGHLDHEWYGLMNSYEAYQFETHPKRFDVTKTWAWAEKNVFPTLAFLKKENEVKFEDMLEEAKLAKRHQDYLKRKGAHESRHQDEN